MYVKLVRNVYLRSDSDQKHFALQIDDEETNERAETDLSKTQLKKLIRELQEWLKTAR